MYSNIINILDIIRIKDWLKNIIIFLPIIFSENLSRFELYPELLFAFLIFCFAASWIYIINDIFDIDEDRNHSIKKEKKPLANNRLSIKFAIYLLVVLLILILLLLFFHKIIIYHVLVYLLLNVCYSLFIKKIAILDLIILSFGYLIRLDAGSLILNVDSSILLLLTVFSLSFFVLSIKRLVELTFQDQKRPNLLFYSYKILNFLIYFSAIIFLLSSLLFFLIKNYYLLVLLPVLVFILLRYYLVAINQNRGEFPIDLVIKDKMLLFACLSILIFLIIVYY